VGLQVVLGDIAAAHDERTQALPVVVVVDTDRGDLTDLLAGHAKVREAAVVGVADEEWGQRLKAVVALRADTECTAEELQAYVRANLAGFKVPREIVLVDELPRNATGKVLKRELR